jgi:hypothetical protein
MERTRPDGAEQETEAGVTDGDARVLCIESYLRSNGVERAAISRISFQTIQCWLSGSAP